MPSLLFVAPCDRVILDANGIVSLISILDEIKFQIVGDTVVPTDTTVPMSWNVVTLWEQSSPYDNGRNFEQRTVLSSESNEIVIEARATWTFDKPKQRVINLILGMPIKNPGKHRIRISIREQTDPPKEWKEVATYPLLIELVPSSPAAATTH